MGVLTSSVGVSDRRICCPGSQGKVLLEGVIQKDWEKKHGVFFVFPMLFGVVAS